jgi:hypothetical protein
MLFFVIVKIYCDFYLISKETQGAMPAMGMGSLQDALNKKIQERNNKSGGGVVSKPTQQPPPPTSQIPQSNSNQSKLILFFFNS